MRKNSAVSPICITDGYGPRPNPSKTVRFCRYPQERLVFQCSSESVLSLLCAFYHSLPLWKWVGGYGSASLHSVAMLKSQHFHRPQRPDPWICLSQECAHPSEWCMYSGPCYFKSCHCVSSARIWETSLMCIPCTGHSHVVIGGKIPNDSIKCWWCQ